MRHITTIGTLVLALLTSSCGGGNNSGNSADAGMLGAALPGERHPIEREWTSPCELNIPTTSRKLTFETGQFDHTVLSFLDNSCSNRRLDLTRSGTYQLGAASEVDFSTEAVSTIIWAPELVQEANANSYCDRADWEAGVSYDISDCQLFFPSPLQFHRPTPVIGEGNSLPIKNYDIYTIVDGELQLGHPLALSAFVTSGTSSTPEQRPSEVYTGTDLFDCESADSNNVACNR